MSSDPLPMQTPARATPCIEATAARRAELVGIGVEPERGAVGARSRPRTASATFGLGG
jgi:hypothetical protein